MTRIVVASIFVAARLRSCRFWIAARSESCRHEVVPCSSPSFARGARHRIHRRAAVRGRSHEDRADPIAKEPAYQTKPEYCLLVFGPRPTRASGWFSTAMCSTSIATATATSRSQARMRGREGRRGGAELQGCGNPRRHARAPRPPGMGRRSRRTGHRRQVREGAVRTRSQGEIVHVRHRRPDARPTRVRRRWPRDATRVALQRARRAAVRGTRGGCADHPLRRPPGGRALQPAGVEEPGRETDVMLGVGTPVPPPRPGPPGRPAPARSTTASSTWR